MLLTQGKHRTCAAHPFDYPPPHSATMVIRLHFAALAAGEPLAATCIAGSFPVRLLNKYLCYQERCTNGSLHFLKENCMKMEFSHVQNLSVICLLCSGHSSAHLRRGRVPNFMQILTRFHGKSNVFLSQNSQHSGLLREQWNTDSMVHTTEKEFLSSGPGHYSHRSG